MKTYNTMHIGPGTRSIVNHHDGIQTHKDGSPFFGIAIFHNKRKQAKFVNQLKRDGYKEGRA